MAIFCFSFPFVFIGAQICFVVFTLVDYAISCFTRSETSNNHSPSVIIERDQASSTSSDESELESERRLARRPAPVISSEIYTNGCGITRTGDDLPDSTMNKAVNSPNILT